MEPYFYSTAALQTYSAYQMQGLFGINTDTTDVSILNLNGFYPVVETSPDFDLNLYTTTSVWNLVSIPGGQGAELAWTPVPKPLPVAKENGSVEVKQQADGTVSEILTVNYVTGEVIASVASQDLIDRPASLQVVLDETVVVTDNLGTQLDAIASATTVDEINNIVNKPTGVINIGRGQFGGPLDLNASNYVSFNSVSMTEADTELYAPATATTVPYQGFPPDDFNSSGAIFATGDYLIQIRETATSMVIAEFEVPLSLDGSNEDITF
jgi:hypothetical protein